MGWTEGRQGGPQCEATVAGCTKNRIVTVCGLMPVTGDSVLLGPPAGVQFSAAPFPGWFRVVRVELGLTEGHVYLTGWLMDEAEAGALRREFCRVAGLVIRRQAAV